MDTCLQVAQGQLMYLLSYLQNMVYHWRNIVLIW